MRPPLWSFFVVRFRIFSTILPLALIVGCQSAPQKKPIPDNVLEAIATQWAINGLLLRLAIILVTMMCSNL